MENIEYTLGQQFTTALAYGDVTGLTDVEEHQLKNFEDNAMLNAEGDKWVWDYGNTDETEFTNCEITNLDSDCCTIHQVFLDKE